MHADQLFLREFPIDLGIEGENEEGDATLLLGTARAPIIGTDGGALRLLPHLGLLLKEPFDPEEGLFQRAVRYCLTEFCADGSQERCVALGAPHLAQNGGLGGGGGGADPALRMSLDAYTGPGDHGARGGVAENENELTDAHLELLRLVGLLVRKTFQHILDLVYTALEIDKDSGRGQAHVGDREVPDGADEGVDAAATHNVAGKVERAAGGDCSRLQQSLLKGADGFRWFIATSSSRLFFFLFYGQVEHLSVFRTDNLFAPVFTACAGDEALGLQGGHAREADRLSATPFCEHVAVLSGGPVSSFHSIYRRD